jgi:hypothetical protein
MRFTGSIRVLKKKLHWVSLVLVSCATPNSRAGLGQIRSDEIKYVSADMRHAAFFSDRSARFGSNDLAISSPLALRRSRSGNVSCISLGPVANSIEYAIETPLKKGAHYRCRNTAFTVTQCFAECKGAIILRETALQENSRGSFLRSYMYVDACLGVLILNSSSDLAGGIPLDAELLRGRTGILADEHSPAC